MLSSPAKRGANGVWRHADQLGVCTSAGDRRLAAKRYTGPAWDALTDSSCMQATNYTPRPGC